MSEETLFNEKVHAIAKSLKLQVLGIEPQEIQFQKSTGGVVKIRILDNGFGASAYGVEFNSDDVVEAIYAATQWAAHCR